LYGAKPDPLRLKEDHELRLVGAEEDIRTKEGRSDGRGEKTAIMSSFVIWTLRQV
jgi:hypothetical protein